MVYDPTAGFVTGGGWIESPPGAYEANPLAYGTASFGRLPPMDRPNGGGGTDKFRIKIWDHDGRLRVKPRGK